MIRTNYCLILAIISLSKCATETVSTNDTNGIGYEILLTKLDYLEYNDILEQQKIFANHEKFKNSIFELRPKKHPSDNSKLLTCLPMQKILPFSSEHGAVSSCSEEQSKQSGRYLLSDSSAPTIEVYCEQTLYDGGWIVIQNRFNGSIDFFRNWTDYKNGFGDLNGEFWLGLENVHLLTASKPKMLLVHLMDFKGTVKYAKYEKFSIGSENEKYALRTLEGYSGTLGDSLDYHKGKKFSTPDADNDENSIENCATKRGAWWHKSCYQSNLNGFYKNSNSFDAINWNSFSGKNEGMQVSKMMIK